MHFVYVLKSTRDGHRYVGSANDVERRFREHQRGKVSSTEQRRPLMLLYSECYTTQKEALQREQFLKSGKGRQWLDARGIR